jgi:very-short-patch-repair endonuclease
MRKREMPERSRTLRREAPKAVRLLWWKLKDANANGFHFRRQVPFRGYYLDFADHGHRIVIELDGDQHAAPLAAKHDAHRDRVVADEGYCLVRFWNSAVLDDLDGVMIEIFRHLETCPNHPPTRTPPRYGAPLPDHPTRGRWQIANVI